MSIYDHRQGAYHAWRVAVSIDGQMRQEYFPYNKQGYRDACQLEKIWKKEQKDANASVLASKLYHVQRRTEH